MNTEALSRAHAATTPGEWTVGTDTRGEEICTIHGVPNQPTEDGLGQGWVYIHYQNVQDGEWHWAGPDEKLANAHFIALAHKEVPALIDRIKALEAENARLREAAVMAVAEMSRARGRLETVAVCNEDRRIAAALGGTCDFVRSAITGDPLPPPPEQGQ